MTEQKLTELLRHSYQWGRANGSNRSEKNFNDFLKTEAVQQALRKHEVVGCCKHNYYHIQKIAVVICTDCGELIGKQTDL